MKSRDKRLTIIILQYNNKHLTDNLLTSIFKYEKSNIASFKILLVDNNSTEDDGFYDFGNKYPEIELIKNKSNLGFAKGINSVAGRLDTPYTLLINNDIILLNRAISYCLEELERINGDAITCRMLNDKKQLMRNFSTKPSPLFYLFINLTGISFIWSKILYVSNKTKRVWYINGGFLMLSSKTFKKVGYFTEKFFMYSEDLDLMIKINQIGGKLYFTNKAKVIHLDGKSSALIWKVSEKSSLITKQMLDVYDSHFSKNLFTIFKYSYVLNQLVKYLLTRKNIHLARIKTVINYKK